MASSQPTVLTSATNPRVKTVVKLRQRSHRDDLKLMIVEGFREIIRAMDNQYPITDLFYCPDLFQGTNEPALIARASNMGAHLYECAENVFRKMAYRDRPEGLLALAPQLKGSLADFIPAPAGLLVVAESIEKPGNLGTILRSADATGVTAVLVCDRCTDINNPNVVRASIGALFSLPVIETSSAEALTWLRAHGYQLVAATPHAETLYSESDLTPASAIIVGAEQYGLSQPWLDQADVTVKIPMLGQSDSLNVASATTILLYEAVRQRNQRAHLE